MCFLLYVLAFHDFDSHFLRNGDKSLYLERLEWFLYGTDEKCLEDDRGGSNMLSADLHLIIYVQQNSGLNLRE